MKTLTGPSCIQPSRVGAFIEKKWHGENHGVKTGDETKDVPKFEITPWKINMEPSNHPLRKENDLPNLHDYVPCYSSGV